MSRDRLKAVFFEDVFHRLSRYPSDSQLLQLAQDAAVSPAQVALAYIGRLYKVKREAKLTAESLCKDGFNDSSTHECLHELRLKLRRAQSLPILNQFNTWLENARRRVLPKSPMGQAIAYVLPRWDSLIRYCEDGCLTADNNLAERTLRPCAIGRRNWTFLGGDHGGRTAAILYSFTASCKSNQVEPFAYLRDVIRRMAELRAADSCASDNLKSLLPDTWLKSHPESHRSNSR